ncbi:pentatricopeptide repeat-containing protein, putative, partial [Fagus crenata]
WNVTNYKDALEATLSEASIGNKMVIIAMVNKAYVEGDKPMLDLFWMVFGTEKIHGNWLITFYLLRRMIHPMNDANF